MLSDQEKKEMLADGLDLERGQQFLIARHRRAKTLSTLDNYIEFLMDVQKIKPFDHKHNITLSDKNLL